MAGFKEQFKEQLMSGKNPELNRNVAENFKVLTPKEFGKDFHLETLLAVISSPDRNYNLGLTPSQRPSMGIEAMWIELYGPKERPVFAAIRQMARAGFKVEMHRDWYSENLVNGQFTTLPLSLPFLSPRKNSRKELNWIYNFNKRRLAVLEDEGVEIIPVNVPKIPIGSLAAGRGRDHKKIIFINNPQQERMVAWVGGMNIAEEHFNMIDFMVKIDDPRIAQPLIDEFYRVEKNKRMKNAKRAVTEDTEILIDSGKEESIILKQAIEDIDNAEKTIYVSSAFFPSGQFLKALVRAKDRGVHIAYITANPDIVSGVWGLKNKFSDSKTRKMQIPLMFPENKPVHGKALVIDEKLVIFGSHNFDELGNEELSLRSTNPTLIENIIEGYFRKVAGSSLDDKLYSDSIIPAIDSGY